RCGPATESPADRSPTTWRRPSTSWSPASIVRYARSAAGADDRHPAGREALAVAREGVGEPRPRAADVLDDESRCGIGISRQECPQDLGVLGRGLFAGRRRAGLEPARAREPRHDALDRAREEGVRAESRQFEVKVGCDSVLFLGRGRLPNAHLLFERPQLVVGRTLDGESHDGGLYRLPEFGKGFELDEINRRDDPAASVALRESLALEPHECCTNRRARGAELRLEPALR